MQPNRVGYVSTARLLPPTLPAIHLPRARLDGRLDEATQRPLTTLVAGAGYGKSTTVAAWATERRLCWYACTGQDDHLLTLLRGLTAALRTRVVSLPPELASAVRGSAGPDTDDADRADALAALLAEALDDAGTDDLHLVIDDVGLITADSGGARLLDALVRQAPARLRLVLLTRGALPIELRHSSEVTEITGPQLSFTADETRALLELAGIGDTEVAAAVHAATAGWPAAVRLAAEALRGRTSQDVDEVLRRLNRPGGRLYALLVEEVLERAAPPHRDLVARLAELPRVTAELCTELGVPDAGQALHDLDRSGLLVDLDEADGWYALPPMVREAVRVAVPLEADRRHEVATRAARWFTSAGHLEDALQVLSTAGADSALAELLREHGQRMVATGACAQVVRAVEMLPPELRSTSLQLVEGHARQVLGDWEGALRVFEDVGDAAQPLPAATAWRMGLIHHFRGDLDIAIATYDRGLDDHDDPVERAHLLAWSGTARWLLGDVEGCRDFATRASELARSTGNPAALAITHTTLALVSAADGDRRANDTHYLRALVAAEEAGDVLQLLRIRCNRGSRHLEEGSYHEAINELELALRLGEASGYVALHGLSLCNRAEARRRLGRLEEAIADYESARQIYQSIDSRMVGYALSGLGDVHRIRGDLTMARAAYEEAVEVLEAGNDAQGLSPALAGLARVVAATDLEEAAKIADRAIERSGGLSQVGAHLAAGFVALARADRDTATRFAASAQEAARSRRDRAGLAESLELAALTLGDPRQAVGLLGEAVTIWSALEEPIGRARASLAAARLDPDGGQHTPAALASRRLRELGLSRRAAEVAGTLREVAERRTGTIEIQALGGFTVRRDGIPVPHSAWQSRKARDLVKILIARRGRPTAREQLIALLWPDEDPAQVGNRLSGLLSVARTVFDPDKVHDPNTFLVADRHTIGLDLHRAAVDVEAFLETAAEGLALRTHDPRRAISLLEEAEATYAGDVLEEDPYEDWTIALREEARATYIGVTRAVAAAAADRGEADRAVRYLLRILERDQFDERAHHDLIRALTTDGRHGEARRRYRAYVARMAELGVPGEPFAAIVEG